METPILPKGVKAICPGCGNLRVIRYRGVCQICARNKVPNRPDRRRKNPHELRKALASERNALLLDGESCPLGVLRRMAWNVARLYGPKVIVDDLIQTAYVVLAKSAESWLAGDRSAANLIYYAKKGVRAAMYAQAEADASRGMHSGLRGLFDVKSVAVTSSLRGGLGDHAEPLLVRDLMPVDSEPPFVTRHALLRYRKRVNQSGIAADITNKLPYSHHAPKWMWRCIGRKMQRANMLLQYKGLVFAVINQDLHWGKFRPVVLTVMLSRDLEERRRRNFLGENR